MADRAVATQFAFKKVDAPKHHLKGFEREQARKHKWQTDTIDMQLLNSEGAPVENGFFKCPRNKLTGEFLQKLVSQSPNPCIIDYLQDTSSLEILWLHEIQQKTQPKPFSYVIVPRLKRTPKDSAENAHYRGDLEVVLMNVPTHTNDAVTEVCSEDIREWLMFGLQEEDKDVQRCVLAVTHLNREVADKKKELKQVARSVPRDKAGNELEGDAADEHRKGAYDKLVSEKDELEQELEKGHRRIEAARERLNEADITLTRADPRPAEKTSSWYATFRGGNSDFWRYAVANKQDWQGVKLGCSHGDLKPWAGRGFIPDGAKPYIPDYSSYEANMFGVTVSRLEHGFGTYESINRSDLAISGPNFEMYHGQWDRGEKHGYGVQYDDMGVYTGQFERGLRAKKGRIDGADGATYEGELGCHTQHVDTLLRRNPFAVGEPHGKGKLSFADGSIYDGAFLNGRITGRGQYTNAMGEVFEGDFLDGVLHGKGCFTSVMKEVHKGEFVDGFLHGHGTFDNGRGDVFTGTFQRGNKSGRGHQKYRTREEYEGYFLCGTRTGHGVTHFGNARDVNDPTTGKVELAADHVHSGQWHAGKPASRGMVTFTSHGNSYFMSPKLISLFPWLSQLDAMEEKVKARIHKHRTKQYKLHTYLRQHIAKKKLKLFRQQRHHAKRAMLDDADHRAYGEHGHGGLPESDIRARVKVRQLRIEGVLEKNKVTMADARDVVEHNGFQRAANAVQDLAEKQGKDSRQTSLARAIQSDYEELYERKRLIDMEKIKRRAEQMWKEDQDVTREAERGAAEGGM